MPTEMHFMSYKTYPDSFRLHRLLTSARRIKKTWGLGSECKLSHLSISISISCSLVPPLFPLSHIRICQNAFGEKLVRDIKPQPYHRWNSFFPRSICSWKWAASKQSIKWKESNESRDRIFRWSLLLTQHSLNCFASMGEVKLRPHVSLVAVSFQ